MREAVLDSLSRALNTFAQSLLAAFAVGATITTLAWMPVLVLASTAALISLLQSVVKYTKQPGIEVDDA